MYGYCPLCGAAVKDRERRIGGNDTCHAGHVYPSRLSLSARPPEAAVILRDVNQFLGELETVLDFGRPMGEELAATVRGRIQSLRAVIDRHLSGPPTVMDWTPTRRGVV